LPNWSDPELGTFDFDTFRWTQKVILPSFNALRYLGETREIDLYFEAEDESDVPTETAVSVAKRLIQNQEALVSKLLKALFDDLHGNGPDSGMWWHDAVEDVYWNWDEDPDLRNLRIEKPDSLRELLCCYAINISRFDDGYDTPLATISFVSPIEEEHDIGILTDGTDILGTGYGDDPSPFK